MKFFTFLTIAVCVFGICHIALRIFWDVTLTKGHVYGGVNHAIIVADTNITIASYDFDHFYDTTIVAINSDVTLAKVELAGNTYL